MPDTYRGTPLHSIRLDDELWTALTTRATQEGTTASDVIRAALTAHLAPTEDAS